jgi:hypothetical protein
LELHEALRIKQEAEQAHAEEQAAKKRLEAQIDSRCQGELARAHALFAEAEAMRRDLEEARRRAEVDAERLKRDAEARAAGLEAARTRPGAPVPAGMKQEELAAIERLWAEAEAEVQTDRERLAAECGRPNPGSQIRSAISERWKPPRTVPSRRAIRACKESGNASRPRALVAEAEAMKRELEESKRLAEADTLHRRREEEERLKALGGPCTRTRARDRFTGSDERAGARARPDAP